MSIVSRQLSYDDLREIRETRDEHLELIDGELFVNPAPSPFHQFVSKRLCHSFKQAVDDAGIGEYLDAPVDVTFSDRSVVQPDLLVLRTGNLSLISGRAIEGVPDVVVEIISPSNDFHDRRRKLGLYARHSVPEYWLVDPEERSVTIISDPRDGRYQHRSVSEDMAVSETIHGLAVDLEALFAPVPRFR